MEENIAVRVSDVSMQFKMQKERVDNLKEYFIRTFKRNIAWERFSALSHVSFDIVKGDSVALIGANGAGKSTLLKIIAGIHKPTQGSVQVVGSISPLIELGAGFDMELSAHENIFLNGAVLGHSRKFMQEHYQEIMGFSELWEFEHVPLKNYSSGMIARLGFAIATLVKPDVLIVDEILSVGDYAFQRKCEEKMDALMADGTTLILVSHSLDVVRSVCRKAVWIENGQVKMYGETNQVCDSYIAAVEQRM